MEIITTNNLNKYFVVLSQVSDCIPIIGTVSNLTQIIFKVMIDIKIVESKSIYFQLIAEKTYFELFLKMLPVAGQILSSQEVIFCGAYTSFERLQQVVIEKLHAKQLSLSQVPLKCLWNKTFLKKALASDIDVFSLASFRFFFKTDFGFFQDCLKIKPSCLAQTTNQDFINHKEIRSQIDSCPNLLQFIPASLLLNDARLLEQLIEHVSDDALYNILKDAYGKQVVKKIPSDLLLQALSKSYKILSLIPEDQQTQQHVETAICYNGLAIQFAAARWNHDLVIIEQALEQNPLALEFIDTRFVSFDLFKKSVIKNPLAWALGSLDHQKDNALHFQAIMENAQADPTLFKAHAGHQEAMIFDLALKIVKDDPYQILSIPYPYLLNPFLLEKIIHTLHPEQVVFLKSLFKLLEEQLSDGFKYYLQENHPFYFTKFEPCVKKTITNNQNMTGACVDFVLKQDQSSIFGYAINATFRAINTAFIDAQKSIHMTKKWAQAKIGLWNDCFVFMFKYVENSNIRIINQRFSEFSLEIPFYASAKGDALRLYFKQTKSQLAQLAGYIESLPSEEDKKEIALLLNDAFTYCAGGIQGRLTQMVETYCTFSGNPPLEYRVAILIQKFVNGCLDEILSKTEFGDNNVHAINAYKYNFRHFYLDEKLPDAHLVNLKPQGPLLKIFFNCFNAKTLLDYLYQEAKASEAFKEALISYVKSHASSFMQDDQEYMQNKQDSFIKIKEQIAILQTHLTDYNAFIAFLTTQDEKYRPILLEQINQSGQTLVVNAILKRNLLKCDCDEGTIASLVIEFNKFKPSVQSFNLALISITNQLGLNKETIIGMLKDGCLAEDRLNDLMDVHFKKAYQDAIADAFLQNARDDSGHFKKEALIEIFDKIGVFIDPLMQPVPTLMSSFFNVVSSMIKGGKV